MNEENVPWQVIKGKESLDLLSKFYLTELNPEWVKSIINTDFTEISNIPLEFEKLHSSTNFLGLFNAVNNSLRQYVDLVKSNVNDTSTVINKKSLSILSTSSIYEEDYAESDIYTKFWIDMTQYFSIKSLLAFLFYYVYKGQHYEANEESRELGIQSCSLYFLILSIPGSNAFRVFHPILYLKSLDILKLTTKLNVGAVSPKKGGSRGSRSNLRKSSEDTRGDGNDDEDAELSYLSPSEANKLIRSLNILLNDFLRFSTKFSLKHSPESLEETISILVEITRCEIHNGQIVFTHRHPTNSVTSLTYNAYVALQYICSPLHGNIKKIVILIMKYILYNILMTSRGSSDLSTRALGVIREHSVIFIKYLMIQLKSDAMEGAYILVQHLCLRVPDKADFREKTSRSVVEILRNFPLKEYTSLLKWLFKFSHNEKAGHRLFTLEVISKLLGEEERHNNSNELQLIEVSTEREHNELHDQNKESNENNKSISFDTSENCSSLQPVSTDNSVQPPANRHLLSHNFLLCIVFSRCRDSAATVRSKALALLSECTLSNNPTIVESMKQIFLNKDPIVFTTPHIYDNNINCESPQEINIKEIELPNTEMVMSMLQRRALDDKVTVRKSALQVIENLMKINETMVTSNYLKVLVDHCRDPALLIRKHIIQSLSSIVNMFPNNEVAVETWVSGVFPLILDPEMKVQEKVVELVDEMIISQMRRYNSSSSMTPHQKLPWNILNVVTKTSFHKFFNKILMLWSKTDRVRPQIISVAKTHIGGQFNEQVWTFLSLISQYVDIKDPLFVLNYFQQNLLNLNEVGSYTMQQALKTLGHCIKYIPGELSINLQEELLSFITELTVCVELISPMVNIITLISYCLEGEDEIGQKAIEVWASPILKTCDNYLKKVLFPEKPSCLDKAEEEKFFRCLFTLGEVAQLCPSNVNKRMFLMMQSIIFHQNHCSNVKTTVDRVPSTQTQSSQPPTLSFNPTRRLKTLAVITLGKMCLQHEDQAKRIIPAMGKMLDTTTLPAMKINIIIVLSDMCVRYATLVDPLMPQVAACLRDSDIKVRRTTLTLLINLLQEDYLKLKGSFFYRILQCLCDEDEDIRSTVIFYMTERLLKRFPKIFLQHFIECIFHYNCYEEHESYNKFRQSKQEKELFSLSGAKYREERMMLYRFMLDHMMDDQRFATTQRLCQDVLGGVVDGRIKLNSASLPMLEDTLMVLSSDEIKLAWLKSRPEDSDQPTDQAEQAEMAGIAIKKTIISQVVKRNVIENIVPILIALKHKLAENRSPLMKQLLLYFKEIMKDYKNEVKEILAGDKQLAKEIEFDLRKLEEEQQREIERIQREKEERERQEKRMDKNAPKPSLGTSPKLVIHEKINEISSENETNEINTSKNRMSVIQEIANEEASGSELEATEDSSKVVTDGNLELEIGDVTNHDKEPATRSQRQNDVSILDESESTETDTGNDEPSTTTNVNIHLGEEIDKEKMERDEIVLDAMKKTAKDKRDCLTPTLSSNIPIFKNKTSSSVLLKKALINSQRKCSFERRLSLPETMSEKSYLMNIDSESEGSIPNELANNPSKISVQSLPNDSKYNKEKDNVDDSNENIEGKALQLLITPVKKKPFELRVNLMRAISTPNANKSVINNITFINKTQDLSAISVLDNEKSSKVPLIDESAKSDSQTLLLHFRSPEAFAKDEQFSKLRRNSRKSLNKEFDEKAPKEKHKNREDRNNSKSKETTKRPSGGFLESYSEETSYEEEDSSLFTEAPKIRKLTRRSTSKNCVIGHSNTQSPSKETKIKSRNLDSNKKTKRMEERSGNSPLQKIKKCNEKNRQ